MKICWKKLSPRDRKFRWYKYVQEGLKRENWWVVYQESFVGGFWTLSGESATEYAGANMIKRVLNERKNVKWVVV